MYLADGDRGASAAIPLLAAVYGVRLAANFTQIGAANVAYFTEGCALFAFAVMLAVCFGLA